MDFASSFAGSAACDFEFDLGKPLIVVLRTICLVLGVHPVVDPLEVMVES